MRKLMKCAPLAALAVGLTLAADAPQPPQINTAKFWRLSARAQMAHRQAEAAQRQAEAADLEAQEELASLAKQCAAAFILGTQSDQRAANAGDLICVPKPPDPEKKEK
jgi:hypothetical protein